MNQTVIQVENLCKQYRLGVVSTGTLTHDLNRWWHRLRGKEDPYEKITTLNDRKIETETEYVWALRNVSFEVKEGEVLGIIGKNGAGKSTLLKILSKVTAPTKGSVKIKGRIASLLEVGTGFHPELTGSENIFLNGAILGMTKVEIRSKFEEIVEFSGIGNYIDTPVKRYSSGMYVRLAFAIAAHLEPDILIVDEVLAVGDAEFQRKCLGKMEDVSKKGRTVLFVSHNMAALETLCNRALLIENGTLRKSGRASEIVESYLLTGFTGKRFFPISGSQNPKGNQTLKILAGAVENASTDDPKSIIDVNSSINVCMTILNLTGLHQIAVGFDLIRATGEIVFSSNQTFDSRSGKPLLVKCHIPSELLNDGYYVIHAYFHTAEMRLIVDDKELLSFEVKDAARNTGYLGKVNGIIRPKLKWEGNELQGK